MKLLLSILLFLSSISFGIYLVRESKTNNEIKTMQEVIDTLVIQNREFGRVFKEAREACRKEGKKACPSCVYFEMYNLK